VRRTISIPRIVARITGIISGNRISGSRSSRARARRVIAEKRVPRTQKPMVPRIATRNSEGRRFQKSKLKSTPKRGKTTSSTRIIKRKLKRTLARYRAPRSTGDKRRASRQRFSLSA
jgi:hypothetical protein